MNITVNGEARELGASMTLAEVVSELGYKHRSVAVALNRQFVPRSQHDEIVVCEADEIEILAPMVGG